MNKVSGLGRGLGSLIPTKNPLIAGDLNKKEIPVVDNKNSILQIDPLLIEVNPFQPRTVFSHEELEGLIESIKTYGIISPLIVTPKGDHFELIAGERRWRASKIIGLSKVPVIVREANELQKLELALIENIQRQNLNPMEKAVSYRRLADEFSLTQDQIAQKLGVKRSSVANVLRFLELPLEIQEALSTEKITEGHAKVLAGIKEPQKLKEVFDKIINEDITVRETEFLGNDKSKKTRRKKITERNSNPLIQELEERVRNHLHTKVKINSRGERGEIILEFYSQEDLHSIIDLITGGN